MKQTYLGKCQICGCRLSWWRRLVGEIVCWRPQCRREFERRCYRNAED